MPLSFISELILNAKKKEMEKMMYPMWLVHVIQSTINKTEIQSIQEFMNFEKNIKNNKTAEEIEKDMQKIVEKYREVSSNG